MGKLIVPLIIGLLMGISGGGFFAVYKASAAHATAIVDAKKHGLKPAGDSTHVADADSAHAEGTTGEGEHAVAEPVTAGAHDSTPAHGAAAPTPTPVAPTNAAAASHVADTHAAPATTPAATTAKPVATAAPSHSESATGAAPTVAETEAHQRRLAKIFATMSPKDASRVLTQMTDHDVSIILGLLSDRQAAAILTSLPAPRAAALSQLQPRRDRGTE